jgi:hypothetical protein
MNQNNNRPFFADDLEVTYIAPKPPGFVGPMPQQILKEGTTYYYGVDPAEGEDQTVYTRFPLPYEMLDKYIDRSAERFSIHLSQEELDWAIKMVGHDEIRAICTKLNKRIWNTTFQMYWPAATDEDARILAARGGYTMEFLPPGAWLVTETEVRCGIKEHGSYDNFERKLCEHDIHLYIHDAYKRFPQPNVADYLNPKFRQNIGVSNKPLTVVVTDPVVAKYLHDAHREANQCWVEHIRPEEMGLSGTIRHPITGDPIMIVESQQLGAFDRGSQVLFNGEAISNRIMESELFVDMREHFAAHEVNLKMDAYDLVPRNRAERRAGKRLDGSQKHKRKEWWNR